MTADPLRVREAAAHDLEFLVAGNLALADETEGVQLDAATVRDGVSAVLHDAAKGRYYIAQRGDRAAGQLLVTFEWSDWRNGLFLWVQSVYVWPQHRRRGVFRALYEHVRQLADAPGCCGLRLYVSDENPAARDTYRRLGMVAPGYLVMETPDRLKPA